MTIHKLLPALIFAACGALAQPTITAVANAASFQPTFSPGSIAAIVGTNLTASGTTTTVTVASKAAAVLQPTSSTQINVQLPVDAPLGLTTLTVNVGQASASANITLTAYAPAFFTANAGSFVDAISFKTINAANPATPGETLTGYAVGLGATNPPVATGATPAVAAPTTATVTLALGSESFPTLFAGLTQPGLYQINFTLPKDVTGCATSLVLTVGATANSPGVTSPPVTIPIATQTLTICAAENSATGAVRDATHAAAANSFVTLYLSGLTGANSTGSLFPGTSYKGVEVDFNDVPMPLYNVVPSVNLINTMLPSNAGTSGGTLTVKNANGTSARYVIELGPTDVGMFRLPDPNVPSRKQAAALLVGTYWFAMPASLAPAYNLPTPCTGLPLGMPCGQPAHPGDTIVIYFTGGGLATPNGNPSGQPVPTGSVAPVDGSVLYQTVETPVVTIGGAMATVIFCGIAPGTAAEYQLNVKIPSGIGAGNDVPVTISMTGSTDTATIAIQTP
jgi:uncharacterized protein (TIGR03437 family)